MRAEAKRNKTAKSIGRAEITTIVASETRETKSSHTCLPWCHSGKIYPLPELRMRKESSGPRERLD